MDIFESKRITLNMIDKSMIVFICKNLIVFIRIILKPNARIRRVMHFKNQTLISVKSMTQVFIYFKKKRFFDDKNYLFESNQKQLTAALKKSKVFMLTFVAEI